MYMELGSNNYAEMQLRFQNSTNFALFITALQVGGTGSKSNATNYAVLTQKVWLLN